MYCIAYGKQGLSFELPQGMRGCLATPVAAFAIGDIGLALKQNLQQPLASPPLTELVRPGARVCLAIPDASRPCPTKLLVPAILQELHQAGIRDRDICIIIATGLHRPSTRQEKAAMLGNELVKRYRVIDHTATEPGQLQNLGRTADGIPMVLNKAACEADLLLSIGLVELHQYAGFSGGSKTVAIGLAGEATIRKTHSLAMLQQRGTRIGNIHKNPFRQALNEIARQAGLRFIVNVVLNSRQQVAHLAAGEPGAVFEALVDRAQQISTVSIDHAYPLVIAGVGYPKGANIYQLSRAASYLAWNPRPAVARGGMIILAARCEEGIGGGLTERGFYELMSKAGDPEEIISCLKTDDCQPGSQRAYVMAQVLKYCRVMLVGSRCPELASRVGFLTATDMPQALELARDILGHLEEALIVPQGIQTLVTVTT
jgi:nickel-dependent lactate racemase